MDIIGTDSFGMLEDIYGQCTEMSQFIKKAYKMNTDMLIARLEIVNRFEFAAVVATIIFFIVLGLSRGILLFRLKDLMRRRKLI